MLFCFSLQIRCVVFLHTLGVPVHLVGVSFCNLLMSFFYKFWVLCYTLGVCLHMFRFCISLHIIVGEGGASIECGIVEFS